MHRLGFHVYRESWYAKSITSGWYTKPITAGSPWTDEIMFGDYPEGGGTCGEMALRWYEQSGKSVARLECYSDAFHILAQLPGVLAALAEVGNVTPKQFAAILVANGFVDLTKREQP